jgi:hypothetical protein
VVIQRVDGGSQWLQDTVEDTAHQGADIGPQAQMWVPNQASCHLQQSVQLLQVMAYRFYLLAEEVGLRDIVGERVNSHSDSNCHEPNILLVISSPQNTFLIPDWSLTPLTT